MSVNNGNAKTEADLNKAKYESYIKEFSFRIFQNTKIRITTLVIVVFFIISSTWKASEMLRVAEFEQKLENSEQKIKDNEVERQRFKVKFDRLLSEKELISESYAQIKTYEKTPILLSPVNERSIIGQHVTFNWKYDMDPGIQNLVLEIIKIEKEGEIKRRSFKIPEPSRQNMFFEFRNDTQAIIFWRIGTGGLFNDKSETRLWSRFGSFSIYPSEIDKIKATNELVVATTAKFFSYDSLINCEGVPDNFDNEFIQWVASELKRKLGLKEDIELLFKYVKWDNLFRSVVNGDVDIAISNITKSDRRSDDNPGLNFTSGYRSNTQALIKKKNRKHQSAEDDADRKVLLANSAISYQWDYLRQKLNGKTIAVQSNTTNLLAANYLSERFGSKVSGNYVTYTEVIKAVTDETNDYGIVDGVLWDSISYPALERLDVELDEVLKDFNLKEFGSSKEQYVIAISANMGNTEFIEQLNAIIDSDAAKAEHDRIIKAYEDNNQDKKAEEFECS